MNEKKRDILSYYVKKKYLDELSKYLGESSKNLGSVDQKLG